MSRSCDILPDELRSLYPFQHHFLDLGAAKLHYVDEGRGPTIVLLHGNPTWSFYFRNLILKLRDEYRVIAPDHVGCGLSDKPRNYPYTLRTHIENLEKLLDRVDAGAVVLGVHDWGGPIGFGWAERHARRVRGLIVFNTAAFLGGRLPWRIRACGWPLFGELAVQGLNAFARAALRMATKQPWRMTLDVRRGYLWPYNTYAHRRAILRFVRDIPWHRGMASHSELETIERALPRWESLPTLILWGGGDFCFDDAYLDEWTRRFPKAAVHRFADAGHYVVEDAHERLVPLIQSFLRRVVSIPEFSALAPVPIA